MHKKLLIIAAVAVMLAGATSASAYQETWNGWFNSGWLTFLSGDTFYYSYGSSTLHDTTAGSVDQFYNYTVNPSTFTCATSGYYIMLWPHTPSGYKYTGQSGQKSSHNGVWEGTAKLYNNSHQLLQEFDVSGTWASTGNGFNYDTDPDSYTAEWRLITSNPEDLEGRGGSAGTRQ
jgi:hypothetical protein